jgi:quercetin dioxygenase-like cupin family protein
MTDSRPHRSQPAAAAPDALWSLGCLFVLRAAGEEMEAIEAIAPPGYSPPLHRHDFGSESFYVLEGSVRFVVGDDDAVYGPGDFIRVPPGVAHSFETLGDAPLRTLSFVAPGGLWAFFAECGRPAEALRLPDAIEIPEDLPEIVARHRGGVVGPPLNRPGLRLEEPAAC